MAKNYLEIFSIFKIIREGNKAMIKEAIELLADGQSLDSDAMSFVMGEIMSGEATPAQISAFLMGLRIKGETVTEIAAAAKVMRSKARKIKAPPDAIDTCGTGGDHSLTFNISTASALVVAGAGIPVAKHGNRAASSACGSADVLAELGVNIEADIDTVENCIAQCGIGFLFAPLLHSAMRFAIGPRREMGIRTIFNLLGPLSNPADARYQLLGVYDKKWVKPLAEVLNQLGSKRALVVHGSDGLDEITITGPTYVAELKSGRVQEYEISPEQFGFEKSRLNDIRGGDKSLNAQILCQVLSGEPGPRTEIVLLNAGAAIYVAGKADSIKDGVKISEEVIKSGKAKEKLDQLIKLSRGSG